MTSDNQKYFQEATLLAQRNNRYVIPVKQEYRQYFDGLHDRSATGQTLYIEPMRFVPAKNVDLKEALIGEDKRYYAFIRTSPYQTT